MGYADWSVLFGEQPSASKWNVLGTNDAFFNTQIGSSFSSSTNSTVWWEELGRTTLGGTADTITINPVSSRKYFLILASIINSGSVNYGLRFNNDSGSNYAVRVNTDTAGAFPNDSTTLSAAQAQISPTISVPGFSWVEVVNIATSEKLFYGQHANTGAAGVGTAPSRSERTGKWSNTSSLISRIDLVNTSTGDYASGSQLIILGHD